MGHGILDGCGNIYYGFILLYGLPYIQDRIADLHGIIHLSSREALGTVLEGKVAVGFISQLLKQFSTVNSDLLDLFL